MTGRTLNPPKVQATRNPFNTSKYREDMRGTLSPVERLWKEPGEGLRRLLYLRGPAQYKDTMVFDVETFMKVLASTSADRRRWQKVIKRIDTLASELGVDREQVYYMALAGFIEKYEEALKEHADESSEAGPYGGPTECTEEEFNAILEADRSEPEPVESRKDLVED